MPLRAEEQRVCGDTQKTAIATTSFARDVVVLFTPKDVRGMAWAFDLTSHEDVTAHAGRILDRLQGVGGSVMPPPPPRGEGAWPNERIELFRLWVAEGCPA